MKITILQISLTNIKGIRNKTIDFNELHSSICGRNASGKTTVFDAFTWLLFGKDSKGREKFNIKTLDSDNKAIEKLEHEVSAILLIDGHRITLRKTLVEKWVTRRGSAQEEFSGHKINQYYNDVPCSAGEFQSKIDDICPEHIFKLITNPLYFPTLKSDAQRRTLLAMAGDITDEKIIALKPEFAALFAELSGKTLEEFKKEIASKKKKVKDELVGIPGRIDERKRSNPEPEDWQAIETEISQKQQEISSIEEQMTDRSKAFEAAGRRREEVVRQQNDLIFERSSRELEVRQNALADYSGKQRQRNTSLNKLQQLSIEENSLITSITDCKNKIDTLSQQRSCLLTQYNHIKAEELQFSDTDFICPTCKRSFDINDIENRQEEMKANFNAEKSRRLEENMSAGKHIRNQLDQLTAGIEKNESRLKEIQEEVSALRNSPEVQTLPIAPDVQPILNSDAEIIRLTTEINRLQEQLDADIDIPDVSDLQDKKRLLQEEVGLLRFRLSKKATLEANSKRIAELELCQRELSQEQADLEQKEFVITDFSKTKIQQVEERISGLFSLVKFKMFEEQINGGEKEVCEAMVDGVPFSDLNTAAQINAGLDIINAFCKHYNKYAPIFVDNAESVNTLLSTDSQLIRLVVTSDEQLIIR
ncbi:MAG: AAA family ATPase [Tannerellaceae bacterium]|nr:AAA family ATPase [Tannerellaceae bacterium]